MSLITNLIQAIGSIYNEGRVVYNILGAIIGVFAIHNAFYFIIGLLFARKFPKTEKKHKYAIVIAARNEEKVIGNLLESIKKQDYPSEFLKVFVVADNCTDSTADIVRQHGITCYERFNDRERTKGFALKYLFECIELDYGTDSLEGYFVFDADNLLCSDYVTRMNESFDAGCKIITSYRNTKNFDESWIASTYALHWLRSIRVRHRARAFLHLATNIQGTGFLFASEIVKEGWKYTSLTEDRALTADCVVNGYEISYNDTAMFYDEQPISLRVALTQRTRWAKGHLLAFCDSGWGLFKNFFVGLPYKCQRFNLIYIWDVIRYKWMAFDTFAQLIPRNIYNIVRWILLNLIIFPCYCYTYGINGVRLFGNNSIVADIMTSLLGNLKINIQSGIFAFFECILTVIWLRLFFRFCNYFTNIPIAIYLFIVERKRIMNISIAKKILYCFTWPLFDIIGRYAQYAALFMKVTWKAIPHSSKVKIDDLCKQKADTVKLP